MDYQKFIKDNFKYVGDNFAYEARSIHYNEKKSYKGISGGNVEAAKKVGDEVAKKVLDLGHKKVTFDRSGYKYHGRVKALADAAREGGLEF